MGKMILIAAFAVLSCQALAACPNPLSGLILGELVQSEAAVDNAGLVCPQESKLCLSKEEQQKIVNVWTDIRKDFSAGEKVVEAFDQVVANLDGFNFEGTLKNFTDGNPLVAEVLKTDQFKKVISNVSGILKKVVNAVKDSLKTQARELNKCSRAYQSYVAGVLCLSISAENSNLKVEDGQVTAVFNRGVCTSLANACSGLYEVSINQAKTLSTMLADVMSAVGGLPGVSEPDIPIEKPEPNMCPKDKCGEVICEGLASSADNVFAIWDEGVQTLSKGVERNPFLNMDIASLFGLEIPARPERIKRAAVEHVLSAVQHYVRNVATAAEFHGKELVRRDGGFKAEIVTKGGYDPIAVGQASKLEVTDAGLNGADAIINWAVPIIASVAMFFFSI